MLVVRDYRDHFRELEKDTIQAALDSHTLWLFSSLPMLSLTTHGTKVAFHSVSVCFFHEGAA